MNQKYISLNRELTADQKAVWKDVTDHWGYLVQKKVDKFLEYIHPDFVGFGHESPVQVDRCWLEHWVGFWSKTTDIPVHALHPVNIVIHGDIAIVQYLIFTIEKSRHEGSKRHIRRYTMTWERHDDRWKVIGSHNNLMSNIV
jgi:ketosteroid isomerase-like protein